MTQLGEAIAFGELGGDFECPFKHTKKKVKKDIKNVMPKKWGENDADELGHNLTDEYHFNTPIKFTLWGEKHEAQYTPHHLIPGNASWPKTKLQKWVEKGKSNHITHNYGYDVNGLRNGVSLPGNNGFRSATKMSWKHGLHPDDQAEYAFKCMDLAVQHRQFHDAHTSYNEFVINVLDKIAKKLDDGAKAGKPGCGKKNCQGGSGSSKPYNPPTNLIARLNGVAQRLENHLCGHPSTWKMPIYTSRFALMYQQNISEKKAAKMLKKAGEAERSSR
ncbi:MAG: AHH domain-containing protein [Deferrisomatales bacterium]|nr:AHH domain-containing protein [Deferrisomatales bacterium]